MIYVARHGETEWNELNKVLGRTDIALNDIGKKQAYKLAKTLSAKRIDIVYSSPLCRAVETSLIVAKDLEIECIIKGELIEQNFGIFEGVDRDDPEYQKAKREYFMRYKGGESFLDVAARVYPFIESLESQNKNILLVTHGGVCRMISSYFNDLSNEEFVTFVQGNCQVLSY